MGSMQDRCKITWDSTSTYIWIFLNQTKNKQTTCNLQFTIEKLIKTGIRKRNIEDK